MRAGQITILRIASFERDAKSGLYIVGYEGTIDSIDFAEAAFEKSVLVADR